MLSIKHLTHTYLLSVILGSRHGESIAYARNTWHEAATSWMGHYFIIGHIFTPSSNLS